MNWRRMTHWYGTLRSAGPAAPSRKAAGIAIRSAATGPLILTSVIFASTTVRPFSSYFCDVGTRTPSTTCQSASTTS